MKEELVGARSKDERRRKPVEGAIRIDRRHARLILSYEKAYDSNDRLFAGDDGDRHGATARGVALARREEARRRQGSGGNQARTGTTAARRKCGAVGRPAADETAAWSKERCQDGGDRRESVDRRRQRDTGCDSR